MCKILPHFSKVVWNQTIRSLWSVFCLQRKNVPVTVTFIKACENVACHVQYFNFNKFVKSVE